MRECIHAPMLFSNIESHFTATSATMQGKYEYDSDFEEHIAARAPAPAEAPAQTLGHKCFPSPPYCFLVYSDSIMLGILMVRGFWAQCLGGWSY